MCAATTTGGGGGGGGSQVDTIAGDCRFDDGTINSADRPLDFVDADGFLNVGVCSAGVAGYQIQPSTPAQFQIATTSITVGQASSMTLTFAGVFSYDVKIHLTSTDPIPVQVPPTVVLPAGQTSVDIPVAGLAESGGVTVTASWQDQRATATVIVTAL